ncbi:MAG TPA: YbhB/YbcL family Raf kinase inhibitor-like protein [Anaeromyxobacter sp.]
MTVQALSFSLTSPSFSDGATIPIGHTCEGEDLSPALAWTAAPTGTRSFALVVDDPDAPDPKAPRMTWVHWLVYDLPPDTTGLPEGVGHALPAGARQGVNDWKRTGWGGPCPPIGRHRYFFKLYALDALLGDLGVPAKPALEAALKGHVLAEARLVGTYEKQRP